MELINSYDFKTFFSAVLFFSITLIWIIIAYQYGDWRNWRKYYPTILFFWCGNLIYDIVFYNSPLWRYENPFFDHLFIDFIDALVVFSCTMLLFLPRIPKKLLKQLLYFILWCLVYSAIEVPFIISGGIKYYNGWNFIWSITHNFYQFVLLAIHQSNPILAWLLAMVILIIISSIFKIPLPFLRY